MNKYKDKGSWAGFFVFNAFLVYMLFVGSWIGWVWAATRTVDYERSKWKEKCLENGYAHYDERTGEFIFHDKEKKDE